MKLTQEDIVEIIKLFEQSKFDVCQLEVGELRLTLSNESLAATPLAPAAIAPRPAPVPAAPLAAAAHAAPVVAAPAAVAASAASDEGLVPVAAPVIGTFYACPEPGAKPFVEVGARVDADTTVGLVEVMKVFNAVASGVRGRVERIVVKNEQFVEFGQTLLLVRPD